MLRHFLQLLAWMPFAALAAQPPVVEHLRLQRMDDSFIDAHLERPSGAGRAPVLLMMQGSGCDSLTDPFLALTQPLADRMARLVVEKVGVSRGDDGKSCSADYLAHNTIDLRLTDYLQVIAHLRASAPWWDGDLYVLGASEGGLMAGMVAAFVPETRRVAILSYGGARTMGEVRPAAVVKESRESPSARPISDADLQAVYRSIRADEEGGKSFDGETNTYRWWASILDVRLSRLLRDLRIPVLIAHGELDDMMPVESAREMHRQLQHDGRDVVYCEYRGLDHGFSDTSGNSHLVDVFMSAVAWAVDGRAPDCKLAAAGPEG